MEEPNKGKEGPSKARLPMQDWQRFPYYVSSELWDQMYSQHGNGSAALVALVDHLHALGLRCPSETTQGTICAVVMLRETADKAQGLLENFVDLRRAFLNCKGRSQQVLHQRKSLAVQRGFMNGILDHCFAASFLSARVVSSSEQNCVRLMKVSWA